MLHGFRYIGLAVLIPGVVSSQLASTEFARGLGYGDLTAAILLHDLKWELVEQEATTALHVRAPVIG